MTLGGLPIERWIGRMVRIRRPRGYGPHMRPARLVRLAGKWAVVVPVDHRREDRVELRDLSPYWAANEDLAKERERCRA